MRQMNGAPAPSSFVLAGLVPAIHVFALHRIVGRGWVDARNKSGHDVSDYAATDDGQRRIWP
jgi:hypothetical protein